MAVEWRPSTWGDEISLEYGKSLRTHGDGGGAYRVFGSNGPIGWTDEPLASGPGVILGRKGANRGVQYSRRDFFVIDTAYYVVPKSDLDMRWLYYAIQHYRLGEIDDGSPIPSTTRAAVYVRPLEVPPLREQRAIAHILGTLDDKIELNRRMNETLEGMARALFKSWFVDFEPVRAKMDGRWQPGESLPGLPADLYDLFPDRLVESELGAVPERWRVGRIGDEVNVVGGGTPSTKAAEYWDGGTIPWATPKDLASLTSPVLVETNRSITEAGLGKISSGLLPAGTVLLSSRAPVGYLAIAEVPTAINQGFIAMICDRSIWNHYTLWWADASMGRIKNRAGGTTFAEISKRNFRPIPVLVPPERLHAVWHEHAERLHSRILGNVEESRILAGLRDTLAPKLVSGELRVPDAEQIVDRAT